MFSFEKVPVCRWTSHLCNSDETKMSVLGGEQDGRDPKGDGLRLQEDRVRSWGAKELCVVFREKISKQCLFIGEILENTGKKYFAIWLYRILS